MKILDELVERYPRLDCCKDEINAGFELLRETYDRKGKVLACGNGGSCSDSEHIVGELMKKFKVARPLDKDFIDRLNAYGEKGEFLSEKLEAGLPAISLASHPSLSTAYLNDNTPELTFAQQLLVLGNENDTLIAISTSGNSVNCVYAAICAKAKGMNVLALTGKKESRLSEIADVTIKAPESETYLIQECHLPIYHALCAMLEEYYFG